MGMRPYVIRQGDYLTKLAHAMGFDAEEVWNHADNRALRERRASPEILQPGDVLHVPDRPASGLRVSPHTHNRYKARVPTVEIRLRLRDDADRPLANKAYQVLGAGAPQHGTTDGDGLATLTVPAHAAEVDLLLEQTGLHYRVLIGHMDPIEEPSGVRKRLEHLGYLPPLDATGADADLSAGVSAFQRAQGIEPTGVMDQATRDALERAHGS
jgi:hypothetical protein